MTKVAKNSGFTLIEVLMVIIIIGILAGIAAESLTESVDNMREIVTEREMEMLSRAIVGNPETMMAGHRSDFGYVGDIGAFPLNLQALYTNPGSYSTWSGPYIAPSFVQDSTNFKLDEWGVPYSYTGGITITSSGSGSNITNKIAHSSSDYLQNTINGTILDAANNPPGAIYMNSVDVVVTFPNGSGGMNSRSYIPNWNGSFTLDSIPVGTHLLQLIYTPEVDTLTRYLTVLPRHKSKPSYRFASAYFTSAASLSGDSIIISTVGNAALGGVSFADDDLIKYDPNTDVGAMLLDGGLVYNANENTTAVHILANGHCLLSTNTSATIGSLSFDKDDIVEYDPVAGTATMFLDGSTLFSASENINALHLLPSGHLLLSTENAATAAGLSVEKEDIFDYDIIGNSATLVLDGNSVFSGAANINAVHMLDNGNLAISTKANETIGSLSFGNEDIIEFDTATGIASMYFDGDVPFGTSNENIDALHLGPGTGDVSAYSNGFVGHWKLDESSDTTAADASGNINHGILHNFAGTEWTTGKLDGALEFNGTNDYIEIPHADILNGTTQLSYSAWVYPHNWSGTRQVMAKSVHGGGTNRAQMGIFSESNRICGRAETVGGRKDIRTSLTNLNEWAHIAIVFDSVSFKLYVNGVMADSLTFSNTSLIQTTDMICISKRVGTPQYYFDGLIDDVRIYNVAIAPSVVQTLYNMGN